MKKFNIFEVYGKVHGETVETPKVEVQAYSPISVGRKVPVIVDGKFSLTESLKSNKVEQATPKKKVSENLLGMKKVMIYKSKTGTQRYEYVIKGKKAKVTIDVNEANPEEQGYKGSNMVSIRSSMGEWLLDTPSYFKTPKEVEAFIKKSHPTLVKIANGEIKSNGVAFPD